MIRGTCVHFDIDYINDMFGLTCEDDEHESFASYLRTVKRNKIVADLCEDSTQWIVAPKGSMSIKRENYVRKIIVNETFRCIEMGKSNLFFPLLITNLCLRHNVQKMSLDKVLLVKGRMISLATWSNLTGAEAKEKRKRKMSEPTPKSEAAKTMSTPTPATPLLEEPTLAKSVPIEEHM
ncbi:hypothetical protein V6N12_057286 [Hibiscus sabdariffa]|uniref:Uncharacterized protein n=1 Tax=Hibiscus sabdariffa TaxID=183260 RepID=A0ABR2DBE1_9ROSI